jgi:hypothetical protein
VHSAEVGASDAMASEKEQETAVGSFMGITGVDKERAVFFLQSAGWNVDVSM